MTRKIINMAATDMDVSLVASANDSTCGWLGIVRFEFGSDISGDIAIKIKRRGESFTSIIAGSTISGDGVAVWNGNEILRDGDTLIFSKDAEETCTIIIDFVYEPWGAGTWQTFQVGEYEESSSSSESSSSVSSVSSNSSSSKSLSSESSSSGA
jgi:hypothetical protein